MQIYLLFLAVLSKTANKQGVRLIKKIYFFSFIVAQTLTCLKDQAHKKMFKLLNDT